MVPTFSCAHRVKSCASNPAPKKAKSAWAWPPSSNVTTSSAAAPQPLAKIGEGSGRIPQKTQHFFDCKQALAGLGLGQNPCPGGSHESVGSNRVSQERLFHSGNLQRP